MCPQTFNLEPVGMDWDGTYKPILPTFLLMPREIKLTITAVSGGEG